MSSSRNGWAVLALTMCWLLPGHSSSADSPKQAELSKTQQTILTEQVIPAYQQGSQLAILQFLSPIVAKLDDARIEFLDRQLEDQGIPTSGELLANARLLLIEQNLEASLPKP